MADFVSNLKLWYTLDEGTGTNCADSSGSGLTGTLGSSGWASGKVGANCANLNATRYITVGTSNTLNLTGTALTLAAWINPTAVNNYFRIIERGGVYPAVQFSLVIDGATGKLRYELDRSGLGSPVLSSSAITTSAWTHVAVAYDGSFIDMYINGALDQHLSYTGSITSYSGAKCYIGHYTGEDSQYDWPGMIDDVRIYARALVSADIASLYAYPKPQANYHARMRAA